MFQPTLIQKFLYWARNVRSRELFRALQWYSGGRVLDVGGRDFYHAARKTGVVCDRWFSLEHETRHLSPHQDPKYQCIQGDGCRMPFKDGQFDAVLNVQVIEHVFEPVKMFTEIARVLRPGGHAIFLVPQTSVLHELPHHYYNFTPMWLKEAARQTDLDIIELKPLGGFFATTASHMLHFYFKVFRVKGFSSPEFGRNVLYYVLLPLMMIYAMMNLLICLFFSLGDLTEEANNNLLVARKRKVVQGRGGMLPT